MKRWLVLCLATALVAAGCGGGDAKAPAASGTPPAAAPAPADSPSPQAAPAAAEPRTGGQLTVVIAGDGKTMDPAKATSTDRTMIQMMYSRLLSMSNDGRELRPDLAEEYSVSADGMEYTFKLRKEAKFHDGSPVTAEAIKFSFERLFAIGQGEGEALAEHTDQITAVDPQTLKIRLKTPYTAYPHLVAQAAPGSIVNPAVVKAHATADDPHASDYISENDAGSGPYTLKEWVRDQHVILEKVNDYWGEPGKLDTITFRIIPDSATAGLMIQRGEADILTTVSTDTISAVANAPGVRLVKQQNLERTYFPFNADLEPFDDVRVRQAFSYAVDYDAIQEGVVGQQGAPMPGMLLVGAADWVTSRHAYQRDLKKAKELLSQAGYANGLTVDLYYPQWGNLGDLSQVMQANLAEVGVTVKLHEVGFGPFIDMIEKGTVGWFAWVGEAKFNDPDGLLYFAGHSKAITMGVGGNVGHYRNPEVDDLLDRGTREQDAKKRAEIYKAVDEALTRDAYAIFLYQSVRVSAVRDRVQNYVIPFIGPTFYTDVWVKD